MRQAADVLVVKKSTLIEQKVYSLLLFHFPSPIILLLFQLSPSPSSHCLYLLQIRAEVCPSLTPQQLLILLESYAPDEFDPEPMHPGVIKSINDESMSIPLLLPSPSLSLSLSLSLSPSLSACSYLFLFCSAARKYHLPSTSYPLLSPPRHLRPLLSQYPFYPAPLPHLPLHPLRHHQPPQFYLPA